MNRVKKWIVGGLAAALLLAGVAMVTPSAFAHGGSDELAAELGLTAEAFAAAKEEAHLAAIAEAAAGGWITDEEAAELIENGRHLRLGHGQYYEGIIDQEALLAGALNISTTELDTAKTAIFEARLAEEVSDGRITAEEAADKMAIHEFKEALDKDAILAEALGISTSELDQARANNVTYDELLDSAGMTKDEAREAQEAAMAAAVQQAVDDGTLTEAQAEQILEYDGCGGRDGRGGRGGRGPGDPNGGDAQRQQTGTNV